MEDQREDPRRIAVWEAMAEQFLDTERRHDIPLAALSCLEAGLSIAEARNVWRYEVSPAVWPNVWDVAGEWMLWDPEWLVRTIRGERAKWRNRPGPIQWLVYRSRVHLIHGNWLAIERCMKFLLEVRPEERATTARDLAHLARHFFDFSPDDPATLEASTLQRLQALYPEPFCGIMKPVFFGAERTAADRRVRGALAREARQ